MKYNVAHNVTDYMTAVASMGCNIMIDKPTRVTQSGGTCLDHVYSNLHCDIVDNYIVQADVSDHYGTLSKIKGLFDENTQSEIFYRKSNLSDYEWEAFNSELDSALQHLKRDFTTHDPNFLANKITQTYVELIEKYMPLKKLSINHKRNPDKPWITQGLKKSIRTKFKLYKKARNSGKENHWSAYKKYLNVLTRTKKKAEFLHYKKMSVL